MYKFIKIRDQDNPYDNTTVEVTIDSVTLPEIIESFGDFLKASGFKFPGEIVLSEEETDLR